MLPPLPVEMSDLLLARRAWAAFGAPTSGPWSALRDDPDLDRLPGLADAIEQVPRELLDATGLSATTRRVLVLAEAQSWWIEAERRGEDVSRHVLADQDRSLQRLIQRVEQSSERVPLWHAEIEDLIRDLAAAPVPALSGVTERHAGVDLHQDPDRGRRFRESPVRLTGPGHDLVAGVGDWSAHDPVRRWLGGTRLFDGAPWRWDAASRRPVPP